MFYISAVDEIATIGGFRLGRTQRVEVGWEEISAALGQVVYLLVVLAHRIQYKFDKYCLHVNGSYSKISAAGDPKATKYELYMPFSEEKFNRGLVMLLDCVGAFSEAFSDYRRLLGGKDVLLYSI